MKVYILQEFIDSHNSGVETNILGVYDSREKAQAQIALINREILGDDAFFMHYMFTEDYEPADFDSKDIGKDGIHLYCDGNGDEFDIYYMEREVE